MSRYQQYIANETNKKAILEGGRKFVAIVAAAWVFGHSVGNITWCTGPSMEPTLHKDGGLVLVDIASHKLLQRPYRTGDVVIAVHPQEPSKRKPISSSVCPYALILKLT